MTYVNKDQLRSNIRGIWNSHELSGKMRLSLYHVSTQKKRKQKAENRKKKVIKKSSKNKLNENIQKAKQNNTKCCPVSNMKRKFMKNDGVK